MLPGQRPGQHPGQGTGRDRPSDPGDTHQEDEGAASSAGPNVRPTPRVHGGDGSTEWGTRVAHWTDVLEEVLRTRRGALIGYASLLTLDRSEAEELLHEALVRVFARRRTLGDARSAEAYVRQAIRTTFMDAARRRRRWGARVHLLAADDDRRSPDDTATTGLDVRAALRALPPRERACVVLRYLDDLTVRDVAAELGLSEGAVKRYLSDATRTLRNALGDAVTWPDDGTETLALEIETTEATTATTTPRRTA